MDQHEKEMIDVVNFNHYIRTLTDNLNAISARRRRKGKK